MPNTLMTVFAMAGLVTAAVVADSDAAHADAAAADEGTALAPDYPRNQLRTYLSWAFSRGTEFLGDGHSEDIPTFDAGADIDFLHALGPTFRMGGGLRYACSWSASRTEIQWTTWRTPTVSTSSSPRVAE